MGRIWTDENRFRAWLKVEIAATEILTEAGGLLRRERSPEDRREVHLQLTSRGEKVLRELTLHHREELRSQGPALLESLDQLVSPGKGSAPRKHR